MKQKLINFLIKLDDKSMTTVVLTVIGFFLAFSVLNLITNFYQHKDITLNAAYFGLWLYFFLYTQKSYELRKTQREILGMQGEVVKLLELFMFLKDANSHGVTIQQLEKRGILKMDIVAIPKNQA